MTAISAEGYGALLAQLKARVRQARTRAGFAVNRELVLLYWSLGREILRHQQERGWGAKVVDRLAADLRHEFPEMTGLSPRNLKYMRAFAEAWPEEAIVQEALAQLSWYHNIALLEKLSDPALRRWYVEQALSNGWSRNVLVHQIESGLHERQGRAVTNFASALPDSRSDLAAQVLKDPYNFEFLRLDGALRERELQEGLLSHLRDFLLEFGGGFALVGSQYPLEVGGQDFYLDLLFYHLRLRCFVVVELKTGDFKPEYAGKMGFYLSAVDDLLRHPDDDRTIGLILCRSNNRIIAEYTLRDTHKAMGVSTYQLGRALPEKLREALPEVGELQARLQRSEENEPR